MIRLTDEIPAYLPAWRRFKDRLATATITAGGGGVLLAIILIFFYLFYEVIPLFDNASIEKVQVFSTVAETPLYLSAEEQGEIGLVITGDNQARFFNLADGQLRDTVALGGCDETLVTVNAQSADSELLALGFANGTVRLAEHKYRVTYPEAGRLITPSIAILYPEMLIEMGSSAIVTLAVSDSDEALLVAAQLASGEVVVRRLSKTVDFLTDEVVLESSHYTLPPMAGTTQALYLGSGQRWLYRLSTDGRYWVFDLNQPQNGQFLAMAEGRLFSEEGSLVSSEMLLGGISLLVSSDRGELVQLFMARTDTGHELTRVRAFEAEGASFSLLLPEHRRKGFMGIDSDGALQIFHSTAHRTLLRQSTDSVAGVARAAISPRGNKLLLLDTAGQLQVWDVDNDHPDISWSALWQKVWYESYDEPAYIWQSSASNNEFEPKYSFSPLAFGTLKAAFYTMLIAAPLGICGAIYTAYFMAPGLRRKVKPLIELMEALPTVILGFLAGLWLAPFVENHLAGVFAVILVLPMGVLVFAFLWSRLPLAWRSMVPDGWHAVLLLPVVGLLGYASFAGSDLLELWLFGGDMRIWLTAELDVSFDQRNALIVGIAMGMAVIPTIFSITEDAIFAVPRHLSYGSLALGATPWQTLVGVVLPTASPGIFSALMIGMGRAVGETMIVLMATGNTPIMDANIFEGMRTLAANIAVEVPEAEVGSTHYRVLFLAAFVLFLFTFIVNTIAELVRQRLRIKYGSL